MFIYVAFIWEIKHFSPISFHATRSLPLTKEIILSVRGSSLPRAELPSLSPIYPFPQSDKMHIHNNCTRNPRTFLKTYLFCHGNNFVKKLNT